MTFPIPASALDDRLAIVGTAGSGKTYLTLGAAEHLLARKSRIIFVDPLGVAWGLRLCADGKTASPFQPIIFGGAHGDLPINEHAGALIGETVATMRESCIIDLSQLGTKAAERRFMLAFLTALYRHTNKEPVHVIVDEADMFAPQKLLDKDGDAAKLLGMMETVVRRGRVRGFIPWLITQRPAVLSKDVLSQADGLVALKLTSSQDRDAIGAWIEGQADKAEGRAMLASLPGKQIGEGVLWIPGRGILRDAVFPPKATYDSSRTPKRGEKRQAAELKPIDLGALKERLAVVETDAKANDPKALKAKLAAAEAELAKLRKLPAPSNQVAKSIVPDQKALDRAIWEARTDGHAIGQRQGYEAGHRMGFDQGIKFARRIHLEALQNIGSAAIQYPGLPAMPKLPGLGGPPAKSLAPASASRLQVPAAQPKHITPSVKSGGAGDAAGLPSPQRRVLASIGFWKSVGNDQPTRAQVGGVAGYSPSSGGFNNLLGGLNTSGHIHIPAPGRVQLDSLAPYDPLTLEEAQAKVFSVLSNPERKLVDAMVDAGGGPMTRDELGAATDYSSSSGGFNNLIGGLCTLTIFEKPSAGQVALSDWAKEVLG